MLPGKVCGDVIQWEGEMWKSEERKTEMTAPITLAPLDEQTLAELRHRYDDTSDAETRTRYQMLLLSAAGQTSTQIAQIVLRSQDTPGRVLKRFFVHGFGPLAADLPALLALLPQADLYLQDEFQVAFHPTLTRVWSRKGRRGQRLVEAPGDNRKVYGFGLVDWRDGWFDGRVAPGRTAPACGCGDSFSGTRTNSRRGASSYRQSICTRQGSKCSSATCSGRIINLEAFSSSGKLPVVEIRVFSITCQQFFVSAALGNLSFVYDDDCGGVTDSRETVRNDE